MQKVNYLDFPKEYKLRGKKYLKAIDRVFKSGIYILGPEVKGFEKEFGRFIGAKNCIGVANGLEAIQIALMALGIGSGDEVITTPISAVATTLAILAVGAKPVFVDIRENGQINEDLIENAITKKTKVVLPVHLYGQPCAIDKIKRICHKHKIFLIEDAAQAHGTTLNGRKMGLYGDIACFSFYPTKNLGAIGDGGAIVTNNNKIVRICTEIRDYGQESKYVHSRYGLNSRLDELHAAILREKLKFLPQDNKKRQLIAKKYVEGIGKVKNLMVILPTKQNDSVFHLFVVKTDKRDALKSFLADNGIPSLIHYPITIPDQPMFSGKYRSLKIPVARMFVKEILSLPCHPFMTMGEVEYICNVLKTFF